MIDYLRFFIRHLKFQKNQTYQQSHIYNRKDDWIYNEIYIGNWVWQKKKHPTGVKIILILFANDKIIMNLSYRDFVP